MVSTVDPTSHTISFFPLALRTNLLFDLTGALNVGAEVPLGKHFSVAADFAYGHVSINNKYAMQTMQGSIEGRYWFKWGRLPLTGWNVGVYGTLSGDYDVQMNSGYQGDSFWSAGITGGYSLPVSKCLILDFSLGAGYFFTPETRHYHDSGDGHLIWDETRYNVGRISLTKARVNLVWLIGAKKKVSR